MKSKVDLLWDKVIELGEDNITGKLDYRDKKGYGRITTTLDGERVSIFIERSEERKNGEGLQDIPHPGG